MRASNPGTQAIAGWVLASATAVLGGWGLSLAGQLNSAGCTALLFVTVAMLGVLAWRGRAAHRTGWWRRVGRRLGTPWAALWLLLWALAVFGGALHAPNNIDALTYRLPRVLHWLAAGHWHWIGGNDPRLDYSGTGMEWQMVPLLAVTNSDRLLFLLNALPALLLPGLVFSFLRTAGVAGRVAARWMWLLPAGHVFILQAGGIGNDANGALLFLAACHLARSGRISLSFIAAALLTGWKTSNLPLLLPYAVVAWPALRRVKPSPPALAGVLLVAAGVSALPTLALNQHYSGHWSGDPANVGAVRLTSPVAGVAGNVAQGVWQNVVPPVFPWAGRWNDWSVSAIEPAMRRLLAGDFRRFTLRAGELPQEEWAGIGLLLVVLALGGARGATGRGAGWLGGAGWLAAGIFCLGLGSEMTARLLAPYYPVLLLPLLRCRGQAAWLESRAAQGVAGLMFAVTAGVLLVSPARPLVPLGKWLAPKPAEGPPALRRLATVYEVYAQRADALAGLRAALPPDVREVGFLATADDAETSLWRPYGTRRVRRVQAGDQQLPEWVVVRADAIWPAADDERAWLERSHGEVVRRQSLHLKASKAPEQWALVRLTRAGNDGAR